MTHIFSIKWDIICVSSSPNGTDKVFAAVAHGPMLENPYGLHVGPIWVIMGNTYRLYGPQCQKTCLQRVGNNKGADQSALLLCLISTFVVRFL